MEALSVGAVQEGGTQWAEERGKETRDEAVVESTCFTFAPTFQTGKG